MYASFNQTQNDMMTGNHEFTDRQNPLYDILELVMTVAVTVTHANAGSLWLTDNYEVPSKLHLGATNAIRPDSIETHTLTLNQGIVGHVVKTVKPFIVNDIRAEPGFMEKKMAQKAGFVSLL